MALKYTKINAKTREAVVTVYGGIGENINGDYLASDIAWIDKNGDVDTIIFRINSLGGLVSQGLSLIGAVVGAKTPTLAIIEGIAGSMAGVFALACNKVKINDFARLMLHMPSILDENGEAIAVDKLTPDEKAGLDNMGAQLKELLSRRNKTKEEIDAIMSKDSWFTAKEALSANLVDEIINTGVTYAAKAPKMVMAFAEGFSRQSNLYTQTHDMKRIAAKLGLAETADVTAILAEIEARETRAAEGATKVENGTKILVDAALKFGKMTGKVKDDNEAKLRKLAGADMELFLDFVGQEPADNGKRLSDVVDELSKKLGDSKGGDTKDWHWYEVNDPDALKELKRTDRKAFDKLYADFWGTKAE